MARVGVWAVPCVGGPSREVAVGRMRKGCPAVVVGWRVGGRGSEGGEEWRVKDHT